MAEATHCPDWQVVSAGHVPHVPPHPSSPQTLPPHCRVQHEPPKHTWAASPQLLPFAAFVHWLVLVSTLHSLQTSVPDCASP